MPKTRSIKQKKHPILIVTENLNIGGAEKYTIMVANELYSRGYRVVVLANEGPFRKHLNSGIRFVRAYFEHGFLGVLYGAFQMIRISFLEKIPLIHAQKLESSQAAWLARFVTGVPILKTAHGYTAKELTYLGKKIDKYSDKVVTVIDWLLSELHKNGVRADKLKVIYNGAEPYSHPMSASDAASFKKSLGLADTDKVILCVSRFERGKKIATLLGWFGSIVKKVPHAKLILVGDGPEKNNLIEKTRELHLENSVIYTGGTTDVKKYLQIADIFCTPSVARGMAVLEAMSAGLPIIGIAPTCNPREVRDGKDGFVIPRGDDEKFIEKTIQLLLNSELSKSFGLSGKKRVEQDFNHMIMVDELEKIYKTMRKDCVVGTVLAQ